MDVEAIRVVGTPPIRTSPSRPTEQGNESLGFTGSPENADVSGGEDRVTISSEARSPSPTPEEPKKAPQNTSHSEIKINDNNEVVLKIIDADTGREIREIPPKEQQRLSQAIQNTVDTLISNNKK